MLLCEGPTPIKEKERTSSNNIACLLLFRKHPWKYYLPKMQYIFLLVKALVKWGSSSTKSSAFRTSKSLRSMETKSHYGNWSDEEGFPFKSSCPMRHAWKICFDPNLLSLPCFWVRGTNLYDFRIRKHAQLIPHSKTSAPRQLKTLWEKMSNVLHKGGERIHWRAS